MEVKLYYMEVNLKSIIASICEVLLNNEYKKFK